MSAGVDSRLGHLSRCHGPGKVRRSQSSKSDARDRRERNVVARRIDACMIDSVRENVEHVSAIELDGITFVYVSDMDRLTDQFLRAQFDVEKSGRSAVEASKSFIYHINTADF